VFVEIWVEIIFDFTTFLTVGFGRDKACLVPAPQKNHI
jgi:hypothetical protein